MNCSTRPLPFLTRRPSHTGGYTLIEIMLVLSIIMVLLGMGIYQMKGMLGGGKLVAAQGSISAISTALKTYELNAGTLPSTDQGLAALFTKPDSEPRPDRWTQLIDDPRAFQDPWKKPYQYRCPGKHNPRSFDLFSLGEDGVESDDDIGNWTATSR